jgi:hypothetical protein
LYAVESKRCIKKLDAREGWSGRFKNLYVSLASFHNLTSFHS